MTKYIYIIMEKSYYGTNIKASFTNKKKANDYKDMLNEKEMWEEEEEFRSIFSVYTSILNKELKK